MWRCQSYSCCPYHCGITTVYITQTTRRSKKISVAPWWGTWHEAAIHINNVYRSVLKQGGCHKNSHLLQFVARNRKTMAGKVHKQITQNATPGCPRSLFYIGFFFFASLEVLVCSMDMRWQEQQIVILHNASEWTYLYEASFKRLVPLFLTHFRPERLSLLVISLLWSINTLRTLLRTTFSFMEIPTRNFVSTTVSDLTHSFKYDLAYHAAPWPPWWYSKIPRKTGCLLIVSTCVVLCSIIPIDTRHIFSIDQY